MSEHDLSWEGIQAMSHQELGDTLKIFGIESSGSTKRQRLWLHLNHDSRRLTVENLAEMERDKWANCVVNWNCNWPEPEPFWWEELLVFLQAKVTGGVKSNALWEKRLPDVQTQTVKTIQQPEPEEEVIVIEVPENPIDFMQPISQHQIEDAVDLPLRLW